MGVFNDFTFTFKSDSTKSSAFNLENQNQKIFERVLIIDSVFNMFPYMELDINDETGTFTEYLISAEGLVFDTKYGIEEDSETEEGGYLEKKYVWDYNSLVEMKVANTLSGDMRIILHSQEFAYDVKQTNAWNDTVSNIVADIVNNKLNFRGTSFITTTTDIATDWWQINRTCEDQLKILSNYAFNQTYSNSPFLTFFNSADEFYFMTIEELFQQEPINNKDITGEFIPYTFYYSEKTFTDINSVKDVDEFYIGGFSINKENYKPKVYYQKIDSTVKDDEDYLNPKDNIIQGIGKLIVRKDVVDSYSNGTDFEDYGIYEILNDKDMYNGWKNSRFRDIALNYRMDIIIYFNSKAVSGKTINIDIKSEIEDKAYENTELSGKWLIIESTNMSDPDEYPLQKLTIAKSGITLDSNHPFKNDLI